MKTLKKKMAVHWLICLGIVVFLGVFSLLFFVPAVRDIVILIASKLLRRDLNVSVWNKLILEKYKYILPYYGLFLSLFLILGALNFLSFFSPRGAIIFSRTEIKSIFSSKFYGLEFLVILIFLVSIRFYCINQKQSLHLDEGLSISISNRNVIGFWGDDFDLNREFSGEELRNIALWDNPSCIDALKDVFHLHQDTLDSSHTNFYYSLFRLWFLGCKNNGLDYIIYRGCTLNILFFIISYFFLLLLIRRFTDNSVLICFCLVMAFLNPASLSLTVFMRPYELQQTFVIVFSYYVTCCLQSIFNHEDIITKRNFLLGVVVLSLTMLAAYLNMILICLYGLLVIFLALKDKNYRLLVYFVCLFIVSLVCSKLLYFHYANLGIRGEEAGANLLGANVFDNFLATLNGFKTILFANKFYSAYLIFILVLTLVVVYSLFRNSFTRVLGIVVLVNLMAIFFTMYFTPIYMKLFRYVAPLFVILPLAVLVSKISLPVKYSLCSIIAICLFFSVIGVGHQSSCVEHLDDSNFSSYDAIRDSKDPIFINSTYVWKTSCIVPYLNNDSTVIFVKDAESIFQKYCDKLPCIYIIEDSEIENEKFPLTEYLVEQKGRIPYYRVYYIGGTR